ncbi:MAG: rod shape-determining protein MreD [Planctomycetota bacterium]
MNWMGLLAALVVTVLLQTTVCRLEDIPLIDVDLMLVLALLYGLLAPVNDARIAAWLIGLTCDLTTDGPVGVHALALGLTGLFITQMREVVNQRIWWARALIAFLAALPGQLLIPLHLRYMQNAGANVGSLWAIIISAILISLTAALLLALLTRMPLLSPRRHGVHHLSWGRR